MNITQTHITLYGPQDVKLILNANEIYPDNPGMGTPCLVQLANDNTGTYNCVVSTGETVDGDQLDQIILDWLESWSDLVERWLSYQTTYKQS